jgi:hypothetical protein
MINTALTRHRNSYSLDKAINIIGYENSETLNNEPEEIMQKVAGQSAKLLEHTSAPFDNNDNLVDLFQPIKNLKKLCLQS